MDSLIDYIDSNRKKSIDELKQFLAIPSVSSEPGHSKDVLTCAMWLAEHIKSVGLQNVRMFETAGHPIVYADWLHAGADKPTVMFYGHYDVQTVDSLSSWTSPPFEPTVRDGKIYARGATDNKSQVLLQIKCLEAWLRCRGSIPVNVKVLIEGEEETGSVHLQQFLEEHRTWLHCNNVLISDTAMYQRGQPSIVYGLRGLCYMEVRVSGPNRDLHSGSYGGAVQNPLNALAHIISKLKDEKGRVTIPGFYNDVAEPSHEERSAFAELEFDEEEYKRSLGVKSLFGEEGYSTIERLGLRPTLDVNGINGGFTGSGAKNVLPSTASAKISMRLVGRQTAHDIAEKFSDYVQTIVPPGGQIEVECLYSANPVLVPRDGIAVKAAARALKKVFARAPVFVREGNSIPITLLFEKVFNAPTVLMGFGLHDENSHSPNEHFDLDNFQNGAKASALFYEELSAN